MTDIFEPLQGTDPDAVFAVVINGVRTDLPWVKHAQLKNDVLLLSNGVQNDFDAGLVYLREYDYAGWTKPAGEREVPMIDGVTTLDSFDGKGHQLR